MNGSGCQEVHAMSFRDNGMQAKRRRKPDGGFGVHVRLLLPDSDGGFTMTLLPYFSEVKDQPPAQPTWIIATPLRGASHEN